MLSPAIFTISENSKIPDCLTLQLWRDGKEVEKGLGATKGSINLNDYIGFESSFNLDKEANTLALIFKEMVVLIALESREILMKWQVDAKSVLLQFLKLFFIVRFVLPINLKRAFKWAYTWLRSQRRQNCRQDQ